MELSKKQYENLLFMVVVVLAVFRFSYLGLKYIPYLDDYVQYSYYPNLQDNWQRVYWGGAGVLFTRPLAGIFDFFVWSRFWENPGLAVGIISIMHGISAVFFYKAFNMCGLNVGVLFLVLYVLMPVNVEATYWLSASSRIVVSMFFISLAMYFGARNKILFFSVFGFLSVWFYEQTAVLGFTLSIWICVRQKKWHMVLIPAIWAVAVGIFYLKFAMQGDNAHRIASAGVLHSLKGTLSKFAYVVGPVQFKLLTKGFLRGFNQIAANFSLLWLGLLTVLAMLVFSLSQKIKIDKKLSKLDVLWSAMFIIIPLVPFFLIGGNGFNLRNIAPCILGLAVFSDRAASKLFQKYTCVFAAILVFWFTIPMVSEVLDYHYTALCDFNIATKVANQVTYDTKRVKAKIKSPSYHPQNAPFGDHIMSMTGSDWGLTGIVRTISGNERVVVEAE